VHEYKISTNKDFPLAGMYKKPDIFLEDTEMMMDFFHIPCFGSPHEEGGTCRPYFF
jgi:hypothetical protein